MMSVVGDGDGGLVADGAADEHATDGEVRWTVYR